MLLLYSIFHLNLAFSSIPKAHYSLILDRCYWPLLDLTERLGLPFGIEATGYTLQELARLDQTFVRRLRTLWEAGAIEFVGSGYAQCIMPLCPEPVNRHNLRLGHAVYADLLGRQPTTAYVHEQTYAAGLVDLYRDAGYERLVMEWNNPSRHHLYPPETRYRPQQALNPDGSKTITVIWNDSIAFQQLQRYLHQELPLADYRAGLEKHFSADHLRGVAFYGSDAEVLDYHPGALDAGYLPPQTAPDLGRLIRLLELLQADPRLTWVTPSGFAARFPKIPDPIRLESPEYPLPCKKQAKYNPTRWAVTGREDVALNTKCFSRYEALSALEGLRREPLPDLPWQLLLEKWGSDFRTYTTDEKTVHLRQTAARLEDWVDKAFQPYRSQNTDLPTTLFLWSPNDTIYEGPVVLEVQLPHGVLHGHAMVDTDSVCQAYQVEAEDYYQDGSIRWLRIVLWATLPPHAISRVRLMSGEALPHTGAEIVMSSTPFDETLQTQAVSLTVNPKRGAAISALQFRALSDKPWVGTFPHGTFEDIALGADFYSGHFIMVSKNGEKATDLVPGVFQPPDPDRHYPIRVPLRMGVDTRMGRLWKTFYVYQHVPRVDLLYHFRFQDVAASSCRVGMMTVLPEAFDPDTLVYRTVNGGQHAETFALKGRHVTHSDPVSVSVSAQHGLGATEGWVTVEDHRHRLMLRTYPEHAYAMPMIAYQESVPHPFLRIIPSIGEFDDTSHTLRRGHHQAMFTWTGEPATPDPSVLRLPVSLSAHVTVTPV